MLMMLANSMLRWDGKGPCEKSNAGIPYDPILSRELRGECTNRLQRRGSQRRTSQRYNASRVRFINWMELQHDEASSG